MSPGSTYTRGDLTGRLATFEHPYISPAHGGKLRLGPGRGRLKLRPGQAMLPSSDTLRATERHTPMGDGAAEVDQEGVYLTDGVFLYRVVDRVLTAEGEMVEIEDCYGLDAVRVPASDVAARRLRVVTPS